MRKFLIGVLMLLGLSGIGWAADDPRPAAGVVIQSSGDGAEFKRALVLASNMREVLRQTPFEVVVFGPNVKRVTAFSEEVPLIQRAQEAGIRVVACGRSLTAEKIEHSDLAPDVTVVPFGAVHIVTRQSEGWRYLKP